MRPPELRGALLFLSENGSELHSVSLGYGSFCNLCEIILLSSDDHVTAIKLPLKLFPVKIKALKTQTNDYHSRNSFISVLYFLLYMYFLPITTHP